MRRTLPLLCLPLLAQTPDAEVAAAAAKLQPALVAQRRDFHRHPELSNQEARTGRVVAERLKALGLEVRTGVAIHGVVGVLKGALPGPVVAYRADMDALPITEARDTPYRSQTPGVMHACGHDVHTTIGLGIAELLAARRATLHGTVLFLFQPAEEGAPGDAEGGAALMIKEGALDHPRPAAILGLHTSATYPVGTMALKPGPLLASVDPWVAVVKGKMSHGGSSPHQGIDAVYVAAQCVEALQSIRSRRIDPLKPLVLSVGTIHGGVRDNVIAPEVRLEGTLRTLDAGVRKEAKALMRQVLEGVAATHGARVELSFREKAADPVTVNDPALAAALKPSLQRLLGTKALEAEAIMGAEDFSFYAEQVPGAFLWLGVRNEAKGITAGAHTADFDVDEACLEVGVRTMAGLLLDLLEGRVTAPGR
jgi:amidohydrolase